MLTSIKSYMFLPGDETEFEQSYLTRMNRVAIWFFTLHLPVFVGIAYFNDTGPWLAFLLTSATLAGPYLAHRLWASNRAKSVIMGITAMFMGGLLVHFGQGPVQIEMHFYFFVLIALLAVFANPMVIVAAAVTAAAHHLVLYLIVPSSVFNYEAPFWVVGVHAGFVILESIAACFIARSFFDNVIELETRLAKRTAEIDQRNKDMKIILNSVRQGFFTVGEGGEIGQDRSAAAEELLGPVAYGSTFVDVLRRHDESVADWMEVSIPEVFAGVMPVEVTVDQLPSRVNVDDKTFSIEYSPVYEDDDLNALVVVVTDITSEIECEKLEEAGREMLAMIQSMANDRDGFVEFVYESNSIVETLRSREVDDRASTLRRIHTLKGNTAMYGFKSVSEACHRLEDRLADKGGLPNEEDLAEVVEAWRETHNNFCQIAGEQNNYLQVPRQSYASLLQDILSGAAADEIAVRFASWQLEPTRNRLARIGAQARRLAEQLGKGEINIHAIDNDLRLGPCHWIEFWSSFIHLVRNAIQHGLEEPSAREAAGKSRAATIEIETAILDDEFVVRISDDGKGIDWSRVATIAKDRNLPHDTHQELVDVLFTDGVSTTDQVTGISGRGVGMAAVKSACCALEGVISVESQPGEGTTVAFRFPTDRMAPSLMEELKQIPFSERAVGVKKQSTPPPVLSS